MGDWGSACSSACGWCNACTSGPREDDEIELRRQQARERDEREWDVRQRRKGHAANVAQEIAMSGQILHQVEPSRAESQPHRGICRCGLFLVGAEIQSGKCEFCQRNPIAAEQWAKAVGR